MLLPERGYTFSSGFAATVNGNAVTAVSAADGYLSLPNVKTITPTEDFHTHSYGTNWKSDTHNHWYECACGDNSLALWFAVLFISGGVFAVFFVKKLDNRLHIWFNRFS